ncbi:MAG: SGNH/GDSL hydrolase family protein [Gemmatimonadota bacterium]
MIDFRQARRRALGIAAAAAFSLLLVSCGGGTGQPPLFSTVVVFGSSLNDTGNRCILTPNACPPSPPYAQGRYSNGALWVETVAAHYGAALKPSLQGGTNYAYAGADTGAVPGVTTPPTYPSMVSQVGLYLAKANYQASPQALYIVDAGNVGDNFYYLPTLLQTDPNAATKVVSAAVGDMVNMVLTLYSAGARNILVTNAPNVGATPIAQAAGAATAGALAQVSQAFNGALAQQLAGLKAVSAGLNLYSVDIYALEAQVKANPSAYGLTDIANMCLNTLVPNPPPPCTNPQQYFYWDDHHGTAAAYEIIAEKVISTLGQ